MIIPVRCFTCGNVLASKYKFYLKRLSEEREKQNISETIIVSAENINTDKIENTPEKIVMDELKLNRYCCRRHFISQVDIIKYL